MERRRKEKVRLHAIFFPRRFAAEQAQLTLTPLEIFAVRPRQTGDLQKMQDRKQKFQELLAGDGFAFPISDLCEPKRRQRKVLHRARSEQQNRRAFSAALAFSRSFFRGSRAGDTGLTQTVACCRRSRDACLDAWDAIATYSGLSLAGSQAEPSPLGTEERDVAAATTPGPASPPVPHPSPLRRWQSERTPSPAHPPPLAEPQSADTADSANARSVSDSAEAAGPERPPLSPLGGAATVLLASPPAGRSVAAAQEQPADAQPPLQGSSVAPAPLAGTPLRRPSFSDDDWQSDDAEGCERGSWGGSYLLSDEERLAGEAGFSEDEEYLAQAEYYSEPSQHEAECIRRLEVTFRYVESEVRFPNRLACLSRGCFSRSEPAKIDERVRRKHCPQCPAEHEEG